MDFTVGVRNETSSHHKHLVHMFASAIFGIPDHFQNVPDTPQIPLDDLTVDHITLSAEEYQMLREDWVSMAAEKITP